MTNQQHVGIDDERYSQLREMIWQAIECADIYETESEVYAGVHVITSGAMRVALDEDIRDVDPDEVVHTALRAVIDAAMEMLPDAAETARLVKNVVKTALKEHTQKKAVKAAEAPEEMQKRGSDKDVEREAEAVNSGAPWWHDLLR
jgi:hypothetical protein